METTIDPATVELPKPSEVLRELLQHPPLNWTDGKWTDLVPTGSGGTVKCHCQGMMLANYAMQQGLDRPASEDIGGYICRVYDIPRGVLQLAMHANDQIDREDARKLWDCRDYLWAMQQLAPKYLARVIAVYERAGL